MFVVMFRKWASPCAHPNILWLVGSKNFRSPFVSLYSNDIRTRLSNHFKFYIHMPKIQPHKQLVDIQMWRGGGAVRGFVPWLRYSTWHRSSYKELTERARLELATLWFPNQVSLDWAIITPRRKVVKVLIIQVKQLHLYLQTTFPVTV